MPFITTKSNFIEAIVFAWLVIFLIGKWKDRKILIIVVFVVLISDLAANVLKEIIQRVRPCNVLPEVRLLVGCTESFSLPSGHATNAFAVATYLSYTYRSHIPVFFGGRHLQQREGWFSCRAPPASYATLCIGFGPHDN